MLTILGKATKVATTSWNKVPGSNLKLSESQIKNTVATVFKSEYSDNLVARVQVGQSYVNFTVDVTAPLNEGDYIDPKTIRVYKLTNGEKEITRLWGKPL